MNSLFPFLLLAGLLSPSGDGLFAQEKIDFCHNQNNAFIKNEKLTYDLYYNWNFVWLPAGSLEFLIVERNENYYIEVRGKTHDSYEWLFKVDDFYSCTMDKKTLIPYHFLREIKEGNYSINNEIIFDYENNSLVSTVRKNNGVARVYSFEMEACVLDILSLTYNLRNIDIALLKKEKSIDVDLIFDEKIFHIPIRYLGEEKGKKIRNLGRFDLLKISLDLISGQVFKKNSKMIIWVSNDINKVPVLIETPISIGSIKAVLKSFENLKQPWELPKKKQSKLRK